MYPLRRFPHYGYLVKLECRVTTGMLAVIQPTYMQDSATAGVPLVTFYNHTHSPTLPLARTHLFSVAILLSFQECCINAITVFDLLDQLFFFFLFFTQRN